MLSVKLFLGIKVTPSIEERLEQIDSNVIKNFIKNDDIYLSEFYEEGVRYLGKFAGDQIDIASLELLEANIQSLLGLIFSEKNPLSFSLSLFPIAVPECHDRKSVE